MKFFAILSAVLAVAVASPGIWTINELSEAIQSPSTDPQLLPILEAALDDVMVQAISGNPAPTATVSTVVQDFSLWTLSELSDAIQDPATDPALLPYLEHGLNTIMSNLMDGQQQSDVIIATPVGLLPIEVSVPVVPVEVGVVPVAPVETPVAASTSPLVQIIVNVKSQEASPILIHDPILVVEEPIPVEQPNPIDIIAINPDVNPIDVIAISPPEVNPIDVIAVSPPEVNPIDVIAVSPPEVNPIDIIAISPPELNPIDPSITMMPVGGIHEVGPLV